MAERGTPSAMRWPAGVTLLRFWWHRLRGHEFALRAPECIVCLADLTVLPRGKLYPPRSVTVAGTVTGVISTGDGTTVIQRGNT